MNVLGIAFLGGSFHTGHAVRMANFLSESPPEFERTLLAVGDASRMPAAPLSGELTVLNANPDNPPIGAMLEFIDSQNPSVAVFDCLSAAAEAKRYAASKSFTAVFDDLRFEETSAHLAVNAILGNWNEPEAEMDGGRAILQGPKFLVVKPGLSRKAHAREFETGINVLVSIGGTDPARSTLGILKAFEMLLNGEFSALSGKKFAMNVLVSPLHPDISDIREAAARLGAGTGFGIDIGAALSWADIAITGGGITAFEAAAAGAVCFAVPNPESHETDTVAKLASFGAALPLPAGASGETYAGIIAKILENPSKLSAVSANGSKLIDGLGAGRVWQAMLSRANFKGAGEKELLSG